MNEIFSKLASEIGTNNGAVVSVSAATVGTSVTTVKTAVVMDPTWFEVAAPFLQTGAWVIAIIAGILTIRNSLKKK